MATKLRRLNLDGLSEGSKRNIEKASYLYYTAGKRDVIIVNTHGIHIDAALFKILFKYARIHIFFLKLAPLSLLPNY